MLLLLAFVILFLIGFSFYRYFYATKENFADSCAAPSRADMLNAPSPAVSAPASASPPPPVDPNAPPQTCEEMATAAVTAGLMAGKTLDDVIKGAQANETARAAAAAAAASASSASVLGPGAAGGVGGVAGAAGAAGAGGSGAAGSAGVGVGGAAASSGGAAGGSGGYGAGGSSSSVSPMGQNSGKKSCNVACPSKKK